MRNLIRIRLVPLVLLVSASVAFAEDTAAPQPAANPSLTPKPCAMQSLWMLQGGTKLLSERLKLTEDQNTKVAQVMVKADEALKPLIEAQRKAAQDYAVLLIKPDAREADVKIAADAAIKAEGAILAERIKLLYAIRALLTPEQLSQFNSALEMQTRIWRVDNPAFAPPSLTPAKPLEKPQSAPSALSEIKKNWVASPTGLEYAEIKPGSGPAAKSGDVVTVHYKGWLDNGTVFDTTRKPGRQPFAFKLGAGQVIKGWDEGVAGMNVGGVRELKIPPALGYGSQDMGNIPPNSTLHFEVELIKIGD